jgi:hypothetical protein
MIEEAEDDDDQSEDMERWEEDMMKYGGAKTQTKDNDPYAAPPSYRPAQGIIKMLIDVLNLSLLFSARSICFTNTDGCNESA